MEIKKNEVTRYLCAAAQLNAGFRNLVLDWFVGNGNKAFAPSCNVDSVSVVKYSLAARRKKTIRDILLALLLLVAVYSRFDQMLFDLLGPDYLPQLLLAVAGSWRGQAWHYGIYNMVIGAAIKGNKLPLGRDTSYDGNSRRA